MGTKRISSVRDPQFFFSDSFLVLMNSSSDSSLDGWVVHYPIGLNLAQNFRGISMEENGVIKFSFFIEWSNPNLNDSALTAYSGEILKTESNETRLALEWLQVGEGRLGAGFHCRGRELLRGLSEKDAVGQAHRLAFLDMWEESLKRL